MKTPSLRTVLLAGLLALNAAVIGGVAATVWVRARAEAEEALRDDLTLRAQTLAGLLEMDRKGLEFDLPPKALPEYFAPGSGAYGTIREASGKVVRRSPSLAGKEIPSDAPWTDGAFVFGELAAGPGGNPCVTVTHSFVVRATAATGKNPWTPPPEEQRRYQVVVAADSRPRDARLQSLLVFLAAIGTAALGATVVGGLLVARRVLAPVRRMTEEAAALTPDDPSRRLHPEKFARELHSLSVTLNSALDRLAEALEKQRRFVSDASHELRTPLAVLLGNAELLLRRERTADDYRRGLDRQRRIARRMTRITENLLALARADAGRARMERTRVDLAQSARDVCDEMEATAAEAGVSLVCEAPGDAAIDGDATYLEVLVQNLLSNAVKFTPAGGSVRVTVTRTGGDVVLTVADTGPGIAPEHHERIFERFHRVQDGGDPREGAGLGLAIVAWIAREHAGRVDVDSAPGRGTTMTVRLPLAAAPTSAPAAPSPARSA